MQIILTVDVPDHLDRPGIPMAQIIREAADVIEAQVPLVDHHHMIDHYGNQTCEWTVSAPE